jgi:hypothetical protein
MPDPAHPIHAESHPLPTRAQALLFFLKAHIFQARRAFQNLGPTGPAKLTFTPAPAAAHTLAESRTPLYPSDNPAEFTLQAGKVQNLRIAAAYLNGLHIPRGETFYQTPSTK